VPGGKKRATDVDRDLGRALEHNLSDRVQELWRDVVTQNEFMRQLISAVRIRHGMDTSSFLSHVGYSAGIARGGRTALGGRAVLAILVTAGVVQSADGKIVAVRTAEDDRSSGGAKPNAGASDITDSEPVVMRRSKRNPPTGDFRIIIQVNVNVTAKELHGLGEALRRELEALGAAFVDIRAGSDPSQSE
jgi:hypothetical protein